MPVGFNMRNQTECQKCGGKMQNFWKWEKSSWDILRAPVPIQWESSSTPLFPVWRPGLSARLYRQLIERARASRLATTLTSQLYCDYGVELELISLVSCSCGGDSNNPSCDALTSLSGSPVAVLSACETVETVMTAAGATFNVTNQFALESTATTSDSSTVNCIKGIIFVVPYQQFEFVQFGVTSSLALRSESQRAKQSLSYVYNEDDVVVGKIVGNGFSIQFSSDKNFTGITMCIPLPLAQDVDWTLRSDLFEWDIAISVAPEFKFTPLGLHIPLSAQVACFELLSESDLVYFPIGLVKDYTEATIYNTWDSDEKGLIIFCIIAYLIVLIWATANLIWRLKQEKLKILPPNSELALFSIIVLSSLGAIYLIMVLVGHVRDNHLDPLLLDLPSLCLLTCVTFIIITWRQIITSARSLQLRQSFDGLLPIIFLFPLYILFIGLLVASGALSEVTVYTCATTDAERDALTTSEQLAISYKAIFAFFAFILAVVFVYYSVVLYKQLAVYPNFKTLLRKNGIATVSAAVSLFILVSITLYTTQHQLENTTKLAFMITVLILPSYAITFLFSAHSTFVDAIRETVTKTTASKSGSKKTTQGSSHSINNNHTR